MKKRVAILLLIMSCASSKKAMDPAIIPVAGKNIIQWTTNQETGVVNYQLQQSSDNINWIVINTIPPRFGATNSYTYTLALGKKFYRVKANMKSGIYYSKTVLSTR